MTLSIWNSAIQFVTGLRTTMVGMAAFDGGSHTWPTILFAIGFYAAATGIHDLLAIEAAGEARKVRAGLTEASYIDSHRIDLPRAGSC